MWILRSIPYLLPTRSPPTASTQATGCKLLKQEVIEVVIPGPGVKLRDHHFRRHGRSCCKGTEHRRGERQVEGKRQSRTVGTTDPPPKAVRAPGLCYRPWRTSRWEDGSGERLDRAHSIQGGSFTMRFSSSNTSNR